MVVQLNVVHADLFINCQLSKVLWWCKTIL